MEKELERRSHGNCSISGGAGVANGDSQWCAGLQGGLAACLGKESDGSTRVLEPRDMNACPTGNLKDG